MPDSNLSVFHLFFGLIKDIIICFRDLLTFIMSTLVLEIFAFSGFFVLFKKRKITICDTFMALLWHFLGRLGTFPIFIFVCFKLFAYFFVEVFWFYLP